ncbi:hypothetical protein N0V90_009454 [Kalmusia sp. IMI 367209]|nr:hypothetical protein N0V90_009454 [Kalmusia sp. IMI 367209]
MDAHMDAPSAQLHLEIRDAMSRKLATRRPILHHLNADTSWLLQIPRPASAVRHGSRIYYNILIDPWLTGPQSDVARWFSQQWHAIESAVKTIAEVEEIARQVEILAGGLRLGKRRISNLEAGAGVETFIDAVAISHEFTDHCHKDTLLEVHPDVPVFATERASLSIYGEEEPSNTSEAAECVIYTPHGIPYSSLEPIAQADPPLQTLAFLHGLHDVSISAAQQLNLGAKNGVLAQRVLRAKYWVGTHDEVKKGGGLVAWFLRRKIWTLEEALKEARAIGDGEDTDMDGDEFEDVHFEDIGNGDSRVLE